MGPNVKKAFVKKNSEKVPPGETILEVLLAESKGGAWRRGISAGTGGVVGAVADGVGASKRSSQEHQSQQAGGDASTWPDGPAYWVVLTDQNLHVFQGRMGSSTVGDSMSYALDKVSDIEFDKKLMISKLHVRFADGSAVELDVAKQKVKPFMEEWDRVHALS